MKTDRTKDEQDVLDHLAAAWNSWCRIKHRDPDTKTEFRHAIHMCQYLVGMRQIARADKSWMPR
jgi:hypothetical protein